MKRSAILLGILILIAGFLSPAYAEPDVPAFTNSDINKLVNNFYNCIEQNNSQKLLTFFSPELARQISSNPEKAGTPGTIYKVINDLSINNGTLTFTNRTIEIDNADPGEIIVTFSGDGVLNVNGKKTNIPFRDVLKINRINKRWLITEMKDISNIGPP